MFGVHEYLDTIATSSWPHLELGPLTLVPIYCIYVRQHVGLLSGGTYWTIICVQA